MIIGTGIDIIDLFRIEQIIKRQTKFANRILVENELNQFEKLSKSRQIEFLAGRFAAKEAYAKARGTGIGKKLSFLDIEIEKDLKGKPYIRSKLEHECIHLSISHSKQCAIAQVIIEEL